MIPRVIVAVNSREPLRSFLPHWDLSMTYAQNFSNPTK
jgi:hypothetical protein